MSNRWKNWSESVQAEPQEIRYPTSQEEISAIVKEAEARHLKVRVVGAGHSFTPLVQTDGILVNLDRYNGIEAVNREKGQVTVRAGTRLKALGKALLACGLAQPNLGDIDVQSIAGAISTGTHGTGATLGSLSTQVAGLTLVTAGGRVLECTEENNPEIFKAAQVSLGALGIISKVTLQLVPAFRLRYEWRRESLRKCLANLEQYVRDNRHFEFYWAPYTDTVLLKFQNPTEQKPDSQKNFLRWFNDMVMDNGALWVVSEISRHFPQYVPDISRVIGALISGGSDVNYSYKIFATKRMVKFNEMEYNLPVENFSQAIQEVDETIRQKRFLVHFPVECRFVHEDDIFLSPAYGRASAYIAVHMYKGMEHRPYFEAMEDIFKKYEGRPHWGKMHNRTAEDLRQLYPEWERFQAVRQELDPEGLFLNDHLKTLFSGTSPVSTANAAAAN
ncbi:MAG TPA: D-arabinono-1,4-lactone oxidase [Chloroflexia bacterium]|nr:D-arabinono-1,4-lactone oxidase [Chloroflexia bacterium]